MDRAEYNESIKDKIGRARATLFTLLIFPMIIFSYLVNESSETQRGVMVGDIGRIDHKIDRVVKDYKIYNEYITSYYGLNSTETCDIASLKTDSINDLLKKQSACRGALRNSKAALELQLKKANFDATSERSVKEKALFSNSDKSLSALGLHLRGIYWNLPKHGLSSWDPITKLAEVPQKDTISVAGVALKQSAGTIILPIVILALQIYLLSIAGEIAASIKNGCEISRGFIFFHQGQLGSSLGLAWITIPPMTFWATHQLQFRDSPIQISVFHIIFSAILSLVAGYKFIKARDAALSSALPPPPEEDYVDYLT
ncbi:MAG: hypothetical protein HRT35_14260 [Algicola sp.]|nr:hypothetical protein [Algicola sp.]